MNWGVLVLGISYSWRKESLSNFPGCNPGNVVVTKAFNLKANYVIHAVGPIYKGGNKNESDLLSSAYRRSIKKAAELETNSILFPAISTGAYGYPLKKAATIAISSIRTASKKFGFKGKVYMVCFDKKTRFVFEKLLKEKAN